MEANDEILFKTIVARGFIFSSNAPENVWRPGSTRTRWGSLGAPLALNGSGCGHIAARWRQFAVKIDCSPAGLNRKLHLVNELHNRYAIALLPHFKSSSLSISEKLMSPMLIVSLQNKLIYRTLPNVRLRPHYTFKFLTSDDDNLHLKIVTYREYLPLFCCAFCSVSGEVDCRVCAKRRTDYLGNPLQGLPSSSY